VRYPIDVSGRGLAVAALLVGFGAGFWRNLIGIWGYLGLAALLVVVVAVYLTRTRLWRNLRPSRLPKTLMLYALVLVVAIPFTRTPGEDALVAGAQLAGIVVGLFLAAGLTWPLLLSALTRAFATIVGLSLLFEIVVGLFVRHPIAPLVPRADEPIWTYGDVFRYGHIQGLVGSSPGLGFIALLLVITVGIQWAQGLRPTATAVIWVVLGGATVAMTRDLPVLTATGVVALMLVVMLLARRLGAVARFVLLVAMGAVKVTVVLLLAWSAQSAGAWATVEQHTGIVGVLLLAALITGLFYRLWWFAVDRPLDADGKPGAHVPMTLYPALLSTALVTVSVWDDIMIVTGGWMLLVTLGVHSKLDNHRVGLDLGLPVAHTSAHAPAHTPTRERVVGA
jgi:exopolysaccharide production protein ExoQ